MTEDSHHIFGGYNAVVSSTWQKDMLATVFDDLNVFDCANPPSDMRLGYVPSQKSVLSRLIVGRVR